MKRASVAGTSLPTIRSSSCRSLRRISFQRSSSSRWRMKAWLASRSRRATMILAIKPQAGSVEHRKILTIFTQSRKRKNRFLQLRVFCQTQPQGMPKLMLRKSQRFSRLLIWKNSLRSHLMSATFPVHKTLLPRANVLTSTCDRAIKSTLSEPRSLLPATTPLSTTSCRSTLPRPWLSSPPRTPYLSATVGSTSSPAASIPFQTSLPRESLYIGRTYSSFSVQ